MNWELLSSIKLEMEGWKDGRGQDGNVGRLEGWKDGRGQDGMLEDWKDGRLGEVLMSYNLSLIS